MKTFLFPTDFSDASTHAVKYGYSIASQIEANIVLCNAVLSPAESPQVGLSVWPAEETDVLLKDSTDKLQRVVSILADLTKRSDFKPGLRITNKSGTVLHIIRNIVKNELVDLVVIGTHETGMLDTLLLGDQARMLIDETTRPLLIVPPSAQIAPVKRIAFATDFKDTKSDMESVETLVSFARPLEAEIFVTHIYDLETQSHEFRRNIKKKINELSKKTGYDRIYFKPVKNSSTGSGLEQMCLKGGIDILAMIHRPHTFIDSLFRGSQTQKMAGHLPIPLLVFPEKVNLPE